jgi:hypothetical protein
MIFYLKQSVNCDICGSLKNGYGWSGRGLISSTGAYSSTGAIIHDEPWPLLRLLFIGPNYLTLVSNF